MKSTATRRNGSPAPFGHSSCHYLTRGCGFADRNEARAAGQGWPVCGFADWNEARATRQGWRASGFTLIELLLVLLIVALLASLAAPAITSSVQRARESSLKQNLQVMRKAIDDFYADNGVYPPTLDALVEKRYIRKLPRDPVTDRADSWVLIRARDGQGGAEGGIVDIHSGSEDKGSDGTPYRDL